MIGQVGMGGSLLFDRELFMVLRIPGAGDGGGQDACVSCPSPGPVILRIIEGETRGFPG
jgi:hypothetical protein